MDSPVRAACINHNDNDNDNDDNNNSKSNDDNNNSNNDNNDNRITIIIIIIIIIMIILIIIVIMMIIVMLLMIIMIILLTANLRTKILDFRGFDPSIILILRDGILMSIGDFLESLSQAILVGIMLVGRLGVEHYEYMALAKETSVFA